MTPDGPEVGLIAARGVLELERRLAQNPTSLADVLRERDEHRSRVNPWKREIDSTPLCRCCAVQPVKRADALWAYMVCDACCALNAHASSFLEIPSLAPFMRSQSGQKTMTEWLDCYAEDDALMSGLMRWHNEPEVLLEWQGVLIHRIAAARGWHQWPDIPSALWQEAALNHADYCARHYVECLFHHAPEFVIEYPFLLDISFHRLAISLPTRGGPHD